MKLLTYALALGLALPCASFAQTPAIGAWVSKSQVVPQVATDIFPGVSVGANPRVRLVLRDTAIDAGVSAATTIWCAKGLAAANPAAINANGFPLNVGIDDPGPGVYQGPINCIQAGGQTHYAQLEQY